MSLGENTDNKKLALSYSSENRKNEISLLWSRSLYFWGFISVVLVAYSSALEKHQLLSFFAACFGFIASLCWTLSNRSSIYWQKVWERKTEAREKDVLIPPIFPRKTNPEINEGWFWQAKQFSPSKLAVAISDLTVAAWAGLIIDGLFPHKNFVSDTNLKIFIGVFTCIYSVTILRWCRSGSVWPQRGG